MSGFQGILPSVPGALRKSPSPAPKSPSSNGSRSPRLQPAKPHNRKHDLDREDELTVNDLYEEAKRDASRMAMLEADRARREAIAQQQEQAREEAFQRAQERMTSPTPPGKKAGPGGPSPRHKGIQEKAGKGG